MKIKVSEATPLQLDWLVAEREGQAEYFNGTVWLSQGGVIGGIRRRPFSPSTNWAQGGPCAAGGMKMKVWVAVYDHAYGTDVGVYLTPEGAQAWKDTIGDTYWEAEIDDPKPDGPCGNAYFERVAELDKDAEYFFVRECEVEP